mgnify:CR=1 FL=1
MTRGRIANELEESLGVGSFSPSVARAFGRYLYPEAEQRSTEMTTIKTTCDHCGDVELRPVDLALELDPNRESGTYRFACPECRSIQRRPARSMVAIVVDRDCFAQYVDKGCAAYRS